MAKEIIFCLAVTRNDLGNLEAHIVCDEKDVSKEEGDAILATLAHIGVASKTDTPIDIFKHEPGKVAT